MASTIYSKAGADTAIAAAIDAIPAPSTGTGSLDTEGVQDVVGAMIVGAGGSYDDGAGTITLPSSGGGYTAVQVGTLTLPASPAVGESVTVLADSTTTLPATVTWDSGGAPTITERMLLAFVWSGEDWVGTYGPAIPAAPPAPDTTNPVWSATFTMGTPTSTSIVATASAMATDEVAVTGYDVTYDGGTTWAAIVPSGNNFTLTGSAETTYSTTQLRARDAAGNTSTPLSVPSYTMAAATTDTPGTLTADGIGATGFNLHVTGAYGTLAAAPFSFSTDGGTTWSAPQISPDYAASGLAASTTYTCQHKVIKADTTEMLGAAIQVITEAQPATLDSAIMALSPSGYWKLDETSGTTAFDSSGNNRDGEYKGTTFTLAGDNSLATFGADGHVMIPDDDAFTAAGSAEGFTVFALAKSTETTPTATRTIVRKPGEWSLLALTGSEIHANVEYDSGAKAMVEQTDAGTFTPGAWHAVVMTLPLPVQGERITVYMDSGTALPTARQTISNDTLANTPSFVAIGATRKNLTQTATSLFKGSLGHIAVFRKQLSSGEVGALVAAAQAEGLIP